MAPSTTATTEHSQKRWNIDNSGGKRNSSGQDDSGDKSNSSGQDNSGDKSNSSGQDNSGGA
jgi:hypothetical protein